MVKKKTIAETVKISRSTNIMFCGCDNKMQDEMHGDHKRVHNRGLKTWCCTSCGTKKNI